MTGKHLMVIGAGIGQVPLVERAKALGVRITVVSKPGDYPCFSLADAVCDLDIYDRDAIVDYARAHGITAVASDQNDLMMPTVAYVAEKLGLPGNKFERVNSYCNKNRFRALCERAGTPVPRHVCLCETKVPAEFADVPLPWIVKPEDSQSSIGVTKISNMAEFDAAARLAIEKSRSGRAILEEFFTGRELVCEGFVRHGKYYNLTLGDRRYFKLPNLLIPTQTLFPSTLTEKYVDKIVQFERNVSAIGGLDFAILHSEYLVNETTGEVRIVETAPRGGGVYISSHLMPAATGIDVTDLVLRLALGEQVDVDAVFAVKKSAASAYVCFCLPEGVVSSVEGVEALQDDPDVITTYLMGVKVGAKTGSMLYKGARKGPILVRAENRDALETVVRRVQKKLRVTVTDVNGQECDMRWE